MENSERLGRQEQPGIEPGLPVLSICNYWWGQGRAVLTSMPYPGFEPGTFDTAASLPNHCTI